MTLQSHTYFRDGFVEFDQANVSIASSPVLYGLSIYTVFGSAWDGENKRLQVFRLRDHYDRLVNSAKIMDFQNFLDEWDYDRFAQTIEQLLTRNKIQEDVLVRATVFVDEIAAGTRMHGLKNSLSAYIYPFGEIMPPSGVHTCVSSWQRNSDKALPSNLKANGGYVNASLMKNEAIINDYDEAIALNDRGQVSEGTVANIFLVKDNTLITPDTSSDILVGITRDTVLQLAKSLQVPCQERTVGPDELYAADEAFFCGSSANITPILSIDKRAVGDGNIGPLTQQIAEAYKNARYGTNPAFSDWLTEVKV